MYTSSIDIIRDYRPFNCVISPLFPVPSPSYSANTATAPATTIPAMLEPTCAAPPLNGDVPVAGALAVAENPAAVPPTAVLSVLGTTVPVGVVSPVMVQTTDPEVESM